MLCDFYTILSAYHFQTNVVPMLHPLIIDIEASGFGRGSYPIEIGFAMPNGDTQCAIIRPGKDWVYWDDDAEKLHGITREALQEHGSSIIEVARLLNNSLAGKLVYSDAWGNDSSWLALLFESAGLMQRFRMESLRALMTEEQLVYWHETKEQVTAECGFQRHRASHDALILQQTFRKTAELARSRKITA